MKLTVVILLLFAVVVARSADPMNEKFTKAVRTIADTSDAVVGVAIRNLATGEQLLINENEVFPQASSIKIHILSEVFRQAALGKFSLDDVIPLPKAAQVGGSGVLGLLTPGTTALTIRDYCVLMMVISDNTATNVLIDRVGMDNVNASLVRNGAPETKLQRKMMDYEAAKAGRENIATPKDVMTILKKLYDGTLVDAESCRRMLAMMKIEKDGWLKAGIDPSVPIANKAGDVEGVRCDVGIVFLDRSPYIICVMAKLLANDAEGERIITEISRTAYRYFERNVHSNVYGRRIPE